MISLYAGLTSQSIDVFIQDSSSTTGAGLAGLVYNSASLTVYYRKGATGSATAITLATQTVGGAWSSGGFVEVDATNMKGVYRLDVPNAVIDTEGFVILVLRGATNMVPTVVRIDCRPLPSDLKKILATGVNTSLAQLGVDVVKISGDSIAATRLSQMFGSARMVTVDSATFAPTTTAFETDQTTDDSERYTEQVLFGLDGNNTGVTSPITAYAFTINSKVKLTVELLPVAPSNGHRFLIMGRIEQ